MHAIGAGLRRCEAKLSCKTAQRDADSRARGVRLDRDRRLPEDCAATLWPDDVSNGKYSPL
jgi:hypothetical protein